MPLRVPVKAPRESRTPLWELLLRLLIGHCSGGAWACLLQPLTCCNGTGPRGETSTWQNHRGGGGGRAHVEQRGTEQNSTLWNSLTPSCSIKTDQLYIITHSQWDKGLLGAGQRSVLTAGQVCTPHRVRFNRTEPFSLQGVKVRMKRDKPIFIKQTNQTVF